MSKNCAVFLLITTVTTGFGFYWPLSTGSIPQHITATFGEWRPAASSPINYYTEDHFHDGVDMVPNTGSAVGRQVYGVESEYCWLNGYYHGGYHYVRTDYHDFLHIDPDTSLHDEDPVTYATEIGDIQDIPHPHLHFSNRAWRSSPEYTNNVLDPRYGSGDRFDSLYEDTVAPEIHQVIFTLDEQHDIVYPPNQIPAYTDIDIIVKAEEFTPYPTGIDGSNGVYTIGFSIDEPFVYDFRLCFDESPSEWELYYVYDTVR